MPEDNKESTGLTADYGGKKVKIARPVALPRDEKAKKLQPLHVVAQLNEGNAPKNEEKEMEEKKETAPVDDTHARDEALTVDGEALTSTTDLEDNFTLPDIEITARVDDTRAGDEATPVEGEASTSSTLDLEGDFLLPDFRLAAEENFLWSNEAKGLTGEEIDPWENRRHETRGETPLAGFTPAAEENEEPTVTKVGSIEINDVGNPVDDVDENPLPQPEKVDRIEAFHRKKAEREFQQQPPNDGEEEGKMNKKFALFLSIIAAIIIAALFGGGIFLWGQSSKIDAAVTKTEAAQIASEAAASEAKLAVETITAAKATAVAAAEKAETSAANADEDAQAAAASETESKKSATEAKTAAAEAKTAEKQVAATAKGMQDSMKAVSANIRMLAEKAGVEPIPVPEIKFWSPEKKPATTPKSSSKKADKKSQPKTGRHRVTLNAPKKNQRK